MSAAHELYNRAVKYKEDFYLSTNFKLSELVKTSKPIENWPTDTTVIFHLHHLCWFVLQKVRNHYGKPVKVTSGYRSPQLNSAIGGAANSQHVGGFAADFEVKGIDNKEAAKWINENLHYDQLILEFYKSAQGIHSGWIHCSYKPTGRRKQFLIARKNKGRTQYLPATIDRLDNL